MSRRRLQDPFSSFHWIPWLFAVGSRSTTTSPRAASATPCPATGSTAFEALLDVDEAALAGEAGAAAAPGRERRGQGGDHDRRRGQAGLKALGLDGRTPTDSRAILEHARNLIQRLSDPELIWPKPLQPGVKLSPAVWIGELEGPVKRLAEARKDVAREERELQATGVAKAKAMSAQDAMFSAGAGFISATLALVGERDLAGKTRPSTRRAGTTAAIEEAGAGAGDGSAAEAGTEIPK
jgi:hypothetical protein